MIRQVDLEDAYTEFAVPLISRKGNRRYVCGTGFFIASNILLTAWHNLEAHVKVVEPWRNRIEALNGHHTLNFSIAVLQTVAPGNYIEHLLETVTRSVFSPDIAIVITAPRDGLKHVQTRKVVVDMLPPTQGSEVKAFGYADSQIVDELPEELSDLEIPDGTVLMHQDPIEPSGNVVEVFPTHRPGLAAFPSFEVDVDFPHGTSGGPVFNDQGYVCGMISSGVTALSGADHGIAASLWAVMLDVIITPSINGGEPFCLRQLADMVISKTNKPYIQTVNLDKLSGSVHHPPVPGDHVALKMLNNVARLHVPTTEESALQ